MTNAIKYEDDKSCIIFCENGKIFFRTPAGRYQEARDIIKVLPNRMKDKKQMIEKYLSVGYKSAARLHRTNCGYKGRKGKLNECDLNEEI